MPNIPSPGQGECKDRGAMGLLMRTLGSLEPAFKVTPESPWDHGVCETAVAVSTFIERGLNPAILHARNVDKQRRRLLAERLERKAHALAMHDAAYQLEYVKRERLLRREKKLRTIAARLRSKP